MRSSCRLRSVAVRHRTLHTCRERPPGGAGIRRRGRFPLAVGLLLGLLGGADRSAQAWIWEHTGIDSTSAAAGQYNSLIIGPGGRLHASYYQYDSFDEGGRNLKYATNLSPRGDGSWSIATVDSDANTGSYSSIALDGKGVPHIAYYAAGEARDLKHARYDSTQGKWVTEFVDQGGSVGQYASIAVNSAGTVYIAYYDASTPSLKLAVKEAGNPWQFQHVDTAGTVGLYTSIDITRDFVITYYDLSNRDLKLARWSGMQWEITTVDQAGDVGRHTSLTTDTHGIYIAYYDASQGALKFAERLMGGPWTITTVDDVGDVGEGARLAVEEGRPCIAYYDRTNGDLKFAARLNGVWVFNVVAQGGNVGRNCALQVDADHLPNLLYLDETRGGLRYAFGVGDRTAIPREEGGPPPSVRWLRVLPVLGARGVRVEADLQEASPVRILIYDIQGRLVRELFRGELAAGPRIFAWDQADETGRRVGRGAYFVQASSRLGTARARVMLLR